MSPGGEYRFDINQLGNAHKWNQLQVKRSLFHSVDRIIISNTSIKRKDVNEYLNLLDGPEYEVQIIRTPGPWHVDASNRRNTHNVPIAILENQILNYVKHPLESEWTEMSIFK